MWFPDWRKGSKTEVKAFDRARQGLEANGRREQRKGTQDETPEYHRLNHRVNERAKPLSPLQRTRVASDERIAWEQRQRVRRVRKSQQVSKPQRTSREGRAGR